MIGRLISHWRRHRKVQFNHTIPYYNAVFQFCSFSSKCQTLDCPNWIVSQSRDTKFESAALGKLLSDVSVFCPGIVRRFRRVPELKFEHVFEILTAVDHGGGGRGIEAGNVRSLLEIFNRSREMEMGVVCFPAAFQAMVELLVHAGLLAEAESMFWESCSKGNLLNECGIIVALIEGYVGNGEVERAVDAYERVRALGRLPSLSCYTEILDHLVRKKDVRLALDVCLDALELGVKLNDTEHGGYNNVIRLVCREGKVQDARNVVKKSVLLGLEPSESVLNEIVSEYCEKANFEDAVSLFHEIKRTPSAAACNKILHLFCKKFGFRESDQVLYELERLGYVPDEVAYGILIGWNCHYGDLKFAFVYLSEIFSRSLEPHVWSYDAIIAALFKEGMWKQAQAVFLEMSDCGINTRLSSFKVLLAGYCKAKQFEEVKAVIREMASKGLIKLSLLEDPLRKAFEVLGFSPLKIRVRRDNHAGFSLAEFYDSLGNGLYLQTDESEYEVKIAEVLEHSITLDFNALVMYEVSNGRIRKSVALANQAMQWGQEVSSSTIACLMNKVRESAWNVKSITPLLKKLPKVYNHLDHETLEWLLQSYSKTGLADQGAFICDVMRRRDLSVSESSYSAILMCLRDKGDLRNFQMCWCSARAGCWLPDMKDVESLVGYLLRHKMLNEALELHQSLIAAHSDMTSVIDNIFIQKLCEVGYTGVAHVLFRRVQDERHPVDQTAYNNLIEGFIKEKKISEALKIYDEMLAADVHPSLTASVLLIPQLCKTYQFDKVNSLGISCWQRYPSELLLIYRTLIGGYSKAGKTDKAATISRNMMMDGAFPDGETFNILIGDRCQTGDLANALQLFSAMIRRNAGLEIQNYGKLVNLLCTKGNVLWSLNLRVYMLSESESPVLVISNILLFYLFKTRKSFYVEKIIGEMREREISFDTVTYHYLVQGYCQCGDAFKSLTCLMTMISKGLKPNTRSLRMVVSFLIELGMIEKVFSVIREMELRGWILSSSVQYKLADVLLRQNRIQDAGRFLDWMEEKMLIGEKIDYNSLIKKFSCLGRLNKAVDLVDVMLRRGNVPDMMAYESLIHGFCTSGKLDDALDFHAEMLDFNIRPSDTMWDVLIQSSCKLGKAEQAENLLTAMIQIGEVPTRNMFCSIVKRYQLGNNLAKASSVLQAMQKYGYDAEFDMQWSVISNLTNSDQKTGGKADVRFLSKLLSDSGFSRR